MEKAAAQKIFAVQEILREDAQYRCLMQEHTVLDARFLETVEGLTERQQAAIFDYLGLLTQMHTRMLELACTCK